MITILRRRWTALFLGPLALFFTLAFSFPTQAQGGPPMITDDPATPGNGMWEVNFLSTIQGGRGVWLLETPNVDLNYGIGNRIQLKLEAPWVIKKESGVRTIGGPGNSMAGIKWRFLEEERNGFDMSIYPQLAFNNPTRSVNNGLVDKGMNLLLPAEAVKSFGSIELNGEIGYRIVQHQPDELEYGLLVARPITKHVELMVEVHGSALRMMRESELILNAGSRISVARSATLLFSAGRTIRNVPGEGPQFIASLGIQFNFRNRLFVESNHK